MSVGRRALLLFVLALLPCGVSAQGPGQPEGLEELRERARRLEEVRGHEAGEDALAHARRAMVEARRLHRAGRRRAAARSLQIAEAALTLADRAAARRRAHLALEDAREREEAARARAATAREALESTLRERARRRRGSE